MGTEAAGLREVVIEARTKIDRPEKWGKGPRIDRGRNTYCVSEAFEDAMDGILISGAASQLRKHLYYLLGDLAGLDRSMTIVAWNDKPTTSYEDVKRVYDHAYAIVKDFK